MNKVIQLRPVTEKDSQLLFNLMTGQNWLEKIGDKGIKTVSDAKQYIIDKMHPELKEKGFINYVIVDEETKDEVGTCSLHNRLGVPGLDVGYAILEEYEGKGYATLAVIQMVDLAIKSYGVKTVHAITTENNIGSCRVLEKSGFGHTGYVQLPSSDENFRLYVLSKTSQKGDKCFKF